MSSHVLPETEPQIHPRNPFARPGPIPDIRLEGLFIEEPVPLVARSDDSSSSDSSNSGGGGSSSTLPIVLGVVIPIAIAFIVLIYLHRRHVKKLRREDAEDKHKSLDFGLNTTPQKAPDNRQNVPQMSMAENKEMGRKRGLSMDMGISNPFLLPPEVQHSRESLHSLSRSLNTGDDRYRNTTFIPDDGSIRPPSSLRSPVDDSSSFTGSSLRFQGDSKQNLLRNGQENPRGGRNASTDSGPGPRRFSAQKGNANLLAPAAATIGRESYVSTTSSNGAFTALRASNNYLGQFIKGGNAQQQEELDKKEVVAVTTEIKVNVAEKVLPPPPAVVRDSRYSVQSLTPPPVTHHESKPSMSPSITVSQPVERQPRLPQLSVIDSQGVQQSSVYDQVTTEADSTAANNTPQHSNAPSIDMIQQHHNAAQEQLVGQGPPTLQDDDYYDEHEAYGTQEYQEFQDYQAYLGYDPRMSTMGMRPLPPDDPSENPEQRANRIRSFYKEYFDETKPQSPGGNVQYYDGAEGYYDSNPANGHYQQEAYFAPPRKLHSSGIPGKHRATVSNGSYMSSPRAFSSASGRFGPPPPSMRQKKKLPPPKPLNVLPTPHMLKDDLFIPTDFAPPQKFRNQRSGTPDSPRGGMKAYRPGPRGHVPLASSFDDLAVMPSPHALRKSSTFTGLEFAPPSRILGAESSMSETGSIRSNRSGMSALHLHNIRTGAYRVSRLPKEVAGTKDEMFASLKPQWNLNR
ncbi:hypothetical protein PV11_06307 [Exophiala sideris]|uniref:Uncharacterized protein n=1 Tax=Exophiala sideris TaxID=1016849 RepID=A0A0D1YV01_9EURO|nr:hypothetical protein PV11_06307 [Exophiala sideris]